MFPLPLIRERTNYNSQLAHHLDLSRCKLLHKSLQPVLQTVRVVIQPESSGCWPTNRCLPCHGSGAYTRSHIDLVNSKKPPNKTKQIKTKLEALGECRPPWPRQIMTPILPNVKILSLGGERLTTKVLDHYLHHNLVMLPLLWVFFAHLLIL